MRVRLALCGETVVGCNATPLCDVPGLEAGATLDVHTNPRKLDSDADVPTDAMLHSMGSDSDPPCHVDIRARMEQAVRGTTCRPHGV